MIADIHTAALAALAVAAAIAIGLEVASSSGLIRGSARVGPLRRLLCAVNRIRYVSADGITFQRDPYSCGAACVRMLLADHGRPAFHDALGRPAASGGFTMLELSRILQRHGFDTRGVRFAAPADLTAALATTAGARALVVLESERLFPYRILLGSYRWLAARCRITVSRYRHWALLDEIAGPKVRLRDPAFGLTEMSTQRFQNLWEGLTLVVRSNPERILSVEAAMENVERPAGEATVVAETSYDSAPVVLDDVSRIYDGRVLAVRQVSCELRSREVFCLLGPNGAGKTTLVKMMTGILPPTSGRIVLDGVDVTKASDAERAVLRRSIGYMPERPFLYERLTPREYLSFIGELCGVGNGAQLRGRIDHHLRSLRLEEKADARIGSLSHGMRRKIAFIAAQIHEPRLLLLDEPTVGLDPASARLVKDRLRGFRDAGRTVLMTTHVLEIAERLADRIGVLDRGSLLFVGTLDEMRRAEGRPGASLEELFMRLTEPGAEGIPASDGEGDALQEDGRGRGQS